MCDRQEYRDVFCVNDKMNNERLNEKFSNILLNHTTLIVTRIKKIPFRILSFRPGLDLDIAVSPYYLTKITILCVKHIIRVVI